MSSVVGGIQVGVVFVWLGAVLAISFLETPLKFRAPGVTVQLAVGIGRLVFRALNVVEGVFAITLIACAVIGSASASAVSLWMLAAVCAILLVGALVLRPLMDRRVRAGSTSEGLSHSSLHVWYILLEAVKVILLVALGVAYLRS